MSLLLCTFLFHSLCISGQVTLTQMSNGAREVTSKIDKLGPGEITLKSISLFSVSATSCSVGMHNQHWLPRLTIRIQPFLGILWQCSGQQLVLSLGVGGPGWIHGWGTKVLQVTQAKKKKKNLAILLLYDKYHCLLFLGLKIISHFTQLLSQNHMQSPISLCALSLPIVSMKENASVFLRTPLLILLPLETLLQSCRFFCISTSHHRGPIGDSLSPSLPPPPAAKILKLPNSFSEKKKKLGFQVRFTVYTELS